MDIEKALVAIKDWYDDEGYSIKGVTTEPEGSDDDFEQSKDFISVVGYQHTNGDSGDSFYGHIYFEYELGKFIDTEFWI